MENLLDNIPEPLLNQINNLGKGLEKYNKGLATYIYDPHKDAVVGLYNSKSNVFIPDYRYFMILDYIGLDGFEEQTKIYNDIIIPNIGLPDGAVVNPKRQRDQNLGILLDTGFRFIREKNKFDYN